MFLGIERGVVVQSAAHGFDNSAAADLLADQKGSYVGVALFGSPPSFAMAMVHLTLENFGSLATGPLLGTFARVVVP
jgi:2-pyrone-4,6-dicarboxylate lactonase